MIAGNREEVGILDVFFVVNILVSFWGFDGCLCVRKISVGFWSLYCS